ncbi:MAG TPA: NADP-dependent phosphogluconate dehydrogenase [Pyrinomonadaceae bacterium]|nr:NADP-dependent phosphogluconate dehydrogenase [Pyrinomonadaceae bacterium]
MSKRQFGMIGLGTMGRNFLLNVAEHGFTCVGYDLDDRKRQLLVDEGAEFSVAAANNLSSFIAELERPRKIMLLVPAGPIVDSVIHELRPLVDKGDIVIDGGNSHFGDTERREGLLNADGIEFLGVGVSGGEKGARHGASIMIGGRPETYEHVRPILEAASAKVKGEPCAAHVGNSSAGHFVKMVHNGIEYGLMQLIAETYDLLRRGYRMDNAQIGELFAEWDKGELNSFLIEISSIVLRKVDAESGRTLVDLILDTAGQKGTGKWTSQIAMDLGVPVPTIDSAVTMRQISALKPERVAAAAKLQIATDELSVSDELRSSTNEFVRDGLHLAFITTYAQGMTLLRAASVEKKFELDMVEIAKIWRGGCIIRAALLESIRQAFVSDPDLSNILVADVFVPVIRKEQAQLKAFVHFAASSDIPCMAAAASLNYLKAMSTERLPANLIQAQRDFFGAHTYLRLDREGVFHTPDWDV